MVFQSDPFRDALQGIEGDAILILNSAADPSVPLAIEQSGAGSITLAEDNIATIAALRHALVPKKQLHVRHVAFHNYIVRAPAETMDLALMNLLYQPSNAWMHYGLEIAAYALRPGGYLYVAGPKERGIQSIARRMYQQFGNAETLEISKGQRMQRSQKRAGSYSTPPRIRELQVFASNKLDDGTRMLLDALEVHATDEALDLGCGAGFIGLQIARQASKGHVTMVDVSMAAVEAAQQAIEQSGLTNVRVLPGDGIEPVAQQRFDLVATNPPFHQGGVQTMEIARRFIREAAQVLRARGRFYLVANRFLKYEPALRASFARVEEVAGDTRYKVLRATL